MHCFWQQKNLVDVFHLHLLIDISLDRMISKFQPIFDRGDWVGKFQIWFDFFRKVFYTIFFQNFGQHTSFTTTWHCEANFFVFRVLPEIIGFSKTALPIFWQDLVQNNQGIQKLNLTPPRGHIIWLILILFWNKGIQKNVKN